jgi:hypothetical protein
VTRLHGVSSQTTIIFIVTTVRTSDITDIEALISRKIEIFGQKIDEGSMFRIMICIVINY